MNDRELPEECELCGAEEDDGGTTVIVGRCPECDAACCGDCMPFGVRTRCVNCEEQNDEEEEESK